MKNLLVCLLIIFMILPTTTFAHYDEINFEYAEELPYTAVSDKSDCKDIVIGSSGVETEYYCMESLPETYPDNEFELMAEENSFENTLLTAWDSLADEIVVRDYNIPKSQIGAAVRKVLFSNPVYYYVNSGFGYSVSSITGCVTRISPTYIHNDIELIKSNIEKIEKATDEILFYIDPGMSEIEKVMTVHDYMVFHYDYDNKSEAPNRNLLIMLDKKGVCMAYTLAFTHLMNQLGIETRYVSSEAMNHSWNLVKVNREWYHIDLTWDDPINMPHYWTSHKYALLSDRRIQELDTPHYGYVLEEIGATSGIYDEASWHDGIAAIVTVDDVSYWVDGNNLVCENGEIIYEGLDGGDSKWSIGNNYVMKNKVYAGLAGYNSKVYFNTDKAIYAYDPVRKTLKLVSNIEGVCGMYVDRNDLYYEKYSLDIGGFEDAGSIHLEETSYSHPYIKDNKLIVKVCRDTDERLRVFSSGANKCNVATVASSGITSMEFDVDSEAYLYFWDENFKPLREKIKINK